MVFSLLFCSSFLGKFLFIFVCYPGEQRTCNQYVRIRFYVVHVLDFVVFFLWVLKSWILKTHKWLVFTRSIIIIFRIQFWFSNTCVGHWAWFRGCNHSMISLVSLNFHAKSVFFMRKLCCADVIRYFVASVGSSRICFKVFCPSKKNWGCPHQVGEGLLVLLEQSHYFNKNPIRAPT